MKYIIKANKSYQLVHCYGSNCSNHSCNDHDGGKCTDKSCNDYSGACKNVTCNDYTK